MAIAVVVDAEGLIVVEVVLVDGGGVGFPPFKTWLKTKLYEVLPSHPTISNLAMRLTVPFFNLFGTCIKELEVANATNEKCIKLPIAFVIGYRKFSIAKL